MSMSDAAETALLNLLFNNAAWANVGNAGGLQPSSAPGNLFVALHTADPGEAGDQTTSEISYTGYGRVPVARSSAGWTMSGNQVSNFAQVQFGEMSGGAGGTATYFSVGLITSGASQIMFSGQLTAPRVISSGITPLFNAGALTGTVD